MTAVKTIEHEQTREVSAPVSQNEALIRMIQEAATNPDIDLDRMERLFEMRERILGKEAETAFYAAMSAAQAELKPVVRNQINSHTRSKYADLEAIDEASKPIITKHGFALTFSEADSPKENHIRVVCKVMHPSGHSEVYHADVPIDAAGAQGRANKNATQAYGSTKTYGRRYLKFDIFDIVVKDQDQDGNQPTDTVSDEQLEELETALTGMDVHAFLRFMGVEQLRDVPTNKFKTAMTAIAQERAKNG